MARSQLEAAQERAADLLRSHRLQAPVAPSEDLSVPENLADLSPDELARHLTHWSALSGYAGYQVAIVDAAFGAAEAAWEMEFDYRYSLRDEKHVTDRRHLAGSSTSVRNLRKQALALRCDLVILRSLRDAYEKNYTAASRELSRREKERERRG